MPTYAKGEKRKRAKYSPAVTSSRLLSSFPLDSSSAKQTHNSDFAKNSSRRRLLFLCYRLRYECLRLFRKHYQRARENRYIFALLWFGAFISGRVRRWRLRRRDDDTMHVIFNSIYFLFNTLRSFGIWLTLLAFTVRRLASHCRCCSSFKVFFPFLSLSLAVSLWHCLCWNGLMCAPLTTDLYILFKIRANNFRNWMEMYCKTLWWFTHAQKEDRKQV